MFNSQLIACPRIRRASAFFMFRDISREASAHRGNYQVHARLSQEAAAAHIFWESFRLARSDTHVRLSLPILYEPISCSASGPPDFQALIRRYSKPPASTAIDLPSRRMQRIQSSKCSLLKRPFSSSLREALLEKYAESCRKSLATPSTKP